MSARSHEIILRREGEGRMAVVKCDCYLITPNAVMKSIIRAVSNWVKLDRLGKNAWLCSSKDFNIADLYVIINDHNSDECHSLTPFLTNQGILSLEIELYGEDDMSDYNYDSILVKEEEE